MSPIQVLPVRPTPRGPLILPCKKIITDLFPLLHDVAKAFQFLLAPDSKSLGLFLLIFTLPFSHAVSEIESIFLWIDVLNA